MPNNMRRGGGDGPRQMQSDRTPIAAFLFDDDEPGDVILVDCRCRPRKRLALHPDGVSYYLMATAAPYDLVGRKVLAVAPLRSPNDVASALGDHPSGAPISLPLARPWMKLGASEDLPSGLPGWAFISEMAAPC